MQNTKTDITGSLPSWCPQFNAGGFTKENRRGGPTAGANGATGGQRRREIASAEEEGRKTKEGFLVKLIIKLDLEESTILSKKDILEAESYPNDRHYQCVNQERYKIQDWRGP